MTEYWFEVPLDYENLSGNTLHIFARSAELIDTPIQPWSNKSRQLPWLLFLQGGPGAGCAPVRQGSWISFFLEKGYKILLMDQRGAGLSSTITAENLVNQGNPAMQAHYLTQFRADNIVRDAEAIRKMLLKDYPDKKWSVLGQSFGGFCSLHYLSFYPDSLREVFNTGGMAPMLANPDALYERLLRKTIEMNELYYTKFPEDIGRVHRLINYLEIHQCQTSDGETLTPHRIQNLGMLLICPSGWETLHNLLLRANYELVAGGTLLRPTISLIEDQVPFDRTILYAILHEACYLSGTGTFSNWSAEQALTVNLAFDIRSTPPDEPIMLTAEIITHDTFTSYKSLRPLLPAAEIIAAYDQWPDLYDDEQLARNEVPVYAAIYVDDLAVDFEYAMQRAKGLGNCKVYVTNRSWHGGLRDDTEEVLGALFRLRDDVMA